MSPNQEQIINQHANGPSVSPKTDEELLEIVRAAMREQPILRMALSALTTKDERIAQARAECIKEKNSVLLQERQLYRALQASTGSRATSNLDLDFLSRRLKGDPSAFVPKNDHDSLSALFDKEKQDLLDNFAREKEELIKEFERERSRPISIMRQEHDAEMARIKEDHMDVLRMLIYKQETELLAINDNHSEQKCALYRKIKKHKQENARLMREMQNLNLDIDILKQSLADQMTKQYEIFLTLVPPHIKM